MDHFKTVISVLVSRLKVSNFEMFCAILAVRRARNFWDVFGPDTCAHRVLFSLSNKYNKTHRMFTESTRMVHVKWVRLHVEC